jgi:chromosome segregation ATPase
MRGKKAVPSTPVAVLLPFIVIACLSACATRKEVVSTRNDLNNVRGSIEGLETSIDRRGAALSEEVQDLERSITSLKSRDEEFRQSYAQMAQRMNVGKIETDENLRHLNALYREYQKSLETNLQEISDKINARLSDLESGLADIRRRLDSHNAVDGEQNRRLGEVTNRLNVFLEEASAESDRFKKGLLTLSQNYNQLVDKVNALNKDLVTANDKLSRESASLAREMDGIKESLKTSAARFHIIAEGETLSSVANRYGLSIDELVRINDLANPNSIKVGQKILLSAP